MQYNDIDIIVSTTLPTVEILSKEKNGGDALILYFKYIKNSRMQENNTTYSTDIFMMKGLGWAKERFYKSKKLLTSLGLIEVIDKREEGKIIGRYVKVKFVIKNQSLEKSDSGKTETNTLVVKEENLSNKKEIVISEKKEKISTTQYPVAFENIWSSFPKARGGLKQEMYEEYKKNRTEEEVLQEIKILKRQIKVGIVDGKYIQASQRRLKNLPKPTSENIEQRLEQILFALMEVMNKTKDKTDTKKFCIDFGDECGKSIAKKRYKMKSTINSFK